MSSSGFGVVWFDSTIHFVKGTTQVRPLQPLLLIYIVVKSLPSAIILAEEFAESKREHVIKCRIEKGSIANLGLYLGFIEGYNYVIEELKRGNVL